ncbi:unnamed protein product [Spirodela intermedia]|uniref:Uncharacterized protein n=1 Tax=Spirodela intermedia TaxID=51605 RepID=A0A7I8KWQ3_SPIIN|nr:unnamed protein product [Spirodela intermedia]
MKNEKVHTPPLRIACPKNISRFPWDFLLVLQTHI